MMQNRNQVGNQSGANGDEEEETRIPPRYFISEEAAAQLNRALPIIIANRMGYISQQAFDEEPTPTSDIKPYIARIVEFDSKEPDFLLPDTPLKESIFRVLLANGNRPMKAEEISEILTEKWAMTAYPRDLTPPVIERLLEHSGSYCIAKIVETEEG